MAAADSDVTDLGVDGDDVLAAWFTAGALAFVVAAVTAAVSRSFLIALPVWLVLWAAGTVVLLRRCGTVIDADGVHRRGVRRRRSLSWTEIDRAVWGEYPARGGDHDGTDVRLYTSSRHTGEYLSLVGAGPVGLVDARTRFGRRNRRRFVAAVRALQAHGVPVDAADVRLRSSMWALGLEPDVS